MSIVIVGAGPNLGASVARRFGREGMPVGLISRDAAKLEALAGELTREGLRVGFRAADIRDAEALSGVIVSLAHELKSGVLVSRDGDGHTGYNSGNACVDEAVESYLIDGTVPEDGLQC